MTIEKTTFRDFHSDRLSSTELVTVHGQMDAFEREKSVQSCEIVKDEIKK